MKTLFDYLSPENQEKLSEYAKSKGVPLGQIKVKESYNAPYYSINPVGATVTKQFYDIGEQVFARNKRKDYIGRRVNIQLNHNFEAGIEC